MYPTFWGKPHQPKPEPRRCLVCLSSKGAPAPPGQETWWWDAINYERTAGPFCSEKCLTAYRTASAERKVWYSVRDAAVIEKLRARGDAYRQETHESVYAMQMTRMVVVRGVERTDTDEEWLPLAPSMNASTRVTLREL